jgi:hypothetical protein
MSHAGEYLEGGSWFLMLSMQGDGDMMEVRKWSLMAVFLRPLRPLDWRCGRIAGKGGIRARDAARSWRRDVVLLSECARNEVVSLLKAKFI